MKPVWSKIPDLAAQEIKLRQKISLLCLMEMTFKRSATQRSISFENIASETELPLKEVELLIMKALALDLVKGEIDQVAGVVNMSWVSYTILRFSKKQNIFYFFNRFCPVYWIVHKLLAWPQHWIIGCLVLVPWKN